MFRFIQTYLIQKNKFIFKFASSGKSRKLKDKFIFTI